MTTDIRLERIAEAHVKDIDAHGGTWGFCIECDHPWPCPTYRWATADLDTVNINCTWDLSECEFTEHNKHSQPDEEAPDGH